MNASRLAKNTVDKNMLASFAIAVVAINLVWQRLPSLTIGARTSHPLIAGVLPAAMAYVGQIDLLTLVLAAMES